MDLNVEIIGLDRIDRATQRVRDEVVKELLKGMQASVLRVERDAKKSILQGQKSGKEYKRGTVVHRASAPGEAPASDTGLLANSIRGSVDKAQLRQGQLEGTVRVGVSYGRPLEFGTRNMAARPFLFPALEANKRWITDRLNKAIATAAINASKGKP
jgi:HK97 gp10 family phage protein